jgi:hypothetical protein
MRSQIHQMTPLLPEGVDVLQDIALEVLQRHHMLTCMLAHFFLWHMRIRLGEKSTIYYAVAA